MIKRKRIFAGMLLIALFIQSTICIAATKTSDVLVAVSGTTSVNLSGSYSSLSARVDKASVYGIAKNNTNNSRYITITTTRYKKGVADGARSNNNGNIAGGKDISSGGVVRISDTIYSYYVTCTVYNSTSSSTGVADALTYRIKQNS